MTSSQPAALWLEQTLAAAHTSLADPVEKIFAQTDALAHATAPDTRRSGKTLVLLEAVCVLLPIVWLLRTPLQLPPILAALAGLASPLLIVGFFWWLRWRSMGRLWSRARLVAEACRSYMGTRATPSQPVRVLLAVVPSLEPLLNTFVAAADGPRADWRDAYLRERIDDQLGYYRRQRDKAVAERHALTRWSTILMDVALAVGVAGMLVTVHPRSASWLNVLGGSWLDFALGMAGVALPLSLLVAQSLRLVGDSTRRTARYTQQIEQLERVHDRLSAAGDDDALPLQYEAEDAVLSEVLDWYFQAETTEDFYTIRDQSAVPVPGQPRQRARFGWLWRALGGLGSASGFVARVVLGRVVWIVLAVALVLMWISLKQPETPEVASRLQELGRMVNPPDGSVFVPQPIAASHGTIVLVHGMRDGWRPSRSDWTHWSAEMTANLQRRLGANMPQIVFLDWKQGATASAQHRLNTKDPLTRFLADLGGIRSSAQSTADFFGIRLVRMVENGQIRSDRPLHIVGHSAGGFVAARAAHILTAMGFPRELLHVTVLDTPKPDLEITQHLPDYADAEFYRTSSLVSVDPATLAPGLRYRYITPPPPPAGVTGFRARMHEHSYAWKWYRDSITDAACGDEGFGRSPFCE